MFIFKIKLVQCMYVYISQVTSHCAIFHVLKSLKQEKDRVDAKILKLAYIIFAVVSQKVII